MSERARNGVVSLVLAGLILAGMPLPILAQTQTPPSVDLTTLSLEDLLNLEVTTASKKAESVFDAPAIMVVVTENDIQTHGGRSLVEVIDRATSVFFMGTQENVQGALTMRGDATLGSNNHILVLVNGRPVQESTHGGMIHPLLRSFPLASIRQIEIIRGPGSVLYGTNAYVGVINVITKDWNSSGTAGASYGSFDTKNVWAAGGKTIGNLQVSAGIAATYDDGWSFTATDSVDVDKPAIARTMPWFDRKVGATFNARLSGFNVDVSFARTETPHMTNSTATTSWNRYGLSDATQAMVDVGYQRALSTRWTSALHGTFNHFLENADFGEIGQREVLSNNYLVEWTNDLSINRSLNAVFGGNMSKRTGSFYESTFDWYGVPDYNRNNFTAFGQADYRPVSPLKLIGGAQVITIPGFDTYVLDDYICIVIHMLCYAA